MDAFDIFDILTLIGGLCLFLFGMNVMGEALERRAGNSLQSLLGKLTTGKIAGLLTGLAVTAVIQSSSATTVMVVGFVNSGLMNLSQAINVIMGANIGTTVTAWILSLAGIEGGNVFTNLLKPMSFTPVVAAIGIVYYMFCKSNKKKDTGMILLGFAVLMFGMDIMSGAVSGLENESWFTGLFTAFENPLLAMLAGALLTAIIQSSSASVGILQALSSTGAVTLGAAIPIIMGQNIGTCITALMSSVGTNKNARRAALVHLSFNVIGTIVWLAVFCIATTASESLALLLYDPNTGVKANEVNIAICHSAFNVACTLLLLPMSKVLEKLAYVLIPEGQQPEQVEELDDRLLATPSLALERCRSLTIDMANCAAEAVMISFDCLDAPDKEKAARIRAHEDKTDHYEDVLGTYLVKLSANRVSDGDSAETAQLLKAIGDFERIADHAQGILCASEEMTEKKQQFSQTAREELAVLKEAVIEIMALTHRAFVDNDLEAAAKVEPLEQIIDRMKEHLRVHHVERLQQGACSIETGFVWADLLTDLGRVSDHCSNIAGGVLDLQSRNMNIHESLRAMKSDSAEFKAKYQEYTAKYLDRV